MLWRTAIGVVAVMMALAAPAWAQMGGPADPSCKGVAVEWPADLKAWGLAAVPVTAATAPGVAPALTPGTPARVTLVTKEGVTLAVTPPKPAGEKTYAGTVAFTVPAAGPYRIAIDGAAWIDVVADGKSLDSTSHKHGPNCSGIHKVVDFGLAAGTYRLQLSNSPAAAVTVLVVPPQS
ncbi:hypothetical protein FBZ87_11288 [Nitrospirillum amazonense]|uniref:Homogentisate 1,2-dioxygenase n=1 Tax=Nitrospirillum amazonense TaxID=28077 RepID=A0A560JAT1_9PROT|nr:hypothetical protein [Nitrospirillum amazonense]TWB68045.1 hypothetical protein FBZ87_11288 [Nitrospirillum amazonense]